MTKRRVEVKHTEETFDWSSLLTKKEREDAQRWEDNDSGKTQADMDVFLPDLGDK